MALEGAISQCSYNGKEAYSNIYTDNEPPFSDLQAALCFLDNQTDNYDSTFLQEGYYGNTTTFLHQPPNEIVINEEKPAANCDISFHGDMGKNQVTRRTRAKKNKEEISNQRMTHIAVERNRRRQMNEYLSVLRSLMPESYVQRVSLINFCICIRSIYTFLYTLSSRNPCFFCQIQKTMFSYVQF